MKIQPYIEKLNSSKQYKDFIKDNKDAFLVAGFFILDLEMGKNIHQIDFYIPSKKKFAAFSLDEKIEVQILDTMSDKVPEKLDIKTNIDLDALKGILEDEMKNRNITENIKKIIAVLQTIKGKKVWNVNSVLSGMDILRVHVEDESKTILKMEKTSFADIMKKLPAQMQAPAPGQTMSIGGGQPGQPGQPAPGLSQAESAVDEAEDQIEKLEKLGEEIEKEKTRLKKVSKKKVKKKA